MAVTTLCLPDDAGIQCIAAIAQDLTEALAMQTAVRLDVSAVARPDLATVQLITAARSEAARTGTDFALAAPVPPAFAELLDRAGFLSGASEDTAFWLHGDMPQ